MRAEQLEPARAFLAAARDPLRGGGILSLPCGFGKTVLALHLMSELGVRTVVVAHKDFLLSQWRERIAQFLPDASVGLVKAGTLDVAGHDIVLASVQSLSMKDYPPDLFDGFGLLVVDECHRVGTEVFSRALMRLNCQHALGLSATVTRKDGMTKAFVHFLGDVLFKVKRAKEAVVVVQHRYWDACPSYSREETLGFGAGAKPNISRMLNNITAHPPRTALAAALLDRVLRAEPARRALVLSDRKSQLTELRALLEAAGHTAGFYWGGLKPPQLRAAEACRVMLATFAYASEGMDVPGLDTLLLASPKTDIEQSVGRILRLKEADRERVPLVLDVVDDFSLFERQGAKRAAFYRRHGYAIVQSLEQVAALGEPERAGAASEQDLRPRRRPGAAAQEAAAQMPSTGYAFLEVEGEEGEDA